MDPGLLLANYPNPPQVLYVTKGHFVHWGGTAVVERLPSGTIIKSPAPGGSAFQEEARRIGMLNELQIYQKIYERYSDHPRIPRVFDWYPESCCLTMEFLENGSLETFMERNLSRGIPLLPRLRWAKQAAEALQVLHSLHIIHCDIFPRNFLLDSEFNLKICDFGGASLNGIDPMAVADTRYLHPRFDWRRPPVFGDDLFSLGSLIYFIMAGEHPYKDVPSGQVEQMYDAYRFPDVSRLFCGDIIVKCWNRRFETAQAVFEVLSNRESRMR